MTDWTKMIMPKSKLMKMTKSKFDNLSEDEKEVLKVTAPEILDRMDKKIDFILTDWQIKDIDNIFHYIVAQISPESKTYLNLLYKKITHLNDWYKEYGVNFKEVEK